MDYVECPGCGGHDLNGRHTRGPEGESWLSWKCGECGHEFVVVPEGDDSLRGKRRRGRYIYGRRRRR